MIYKTLLQCFIANRGDELKCIKLISGVSASGVESSVNTPPEHGVDIMKDDVNDPGFGDEDSIDVTHRTEDGKYLSTRDSPYTYFKHFLYHNYAK